MAKRQYSVKTSPTPVKSAQNASREKKGATGIVPSPAIMVRADVPIAECVRKMRAQNVGSVLVTRDDWTEELVGIFTERDLLRHIEQIEKGAFWERPVRAVMSSSLITVQADELDRAGEIMLEAGIRHLPVVSLSEAGKPVVIGVISMRDLFRDLVRRQKRQMQTLVRLLRKRKRVPKRKMVISSLDSNWARAIEGVLAKLPQVRVRALPQLTPSVPLQGVSALIMDLDHRKISEWAGLLKNMNRAHDPSFIVLVFNPGLHDKKVVAILNQLGQEKNFHVFAKPVNPLEILDRLQKRLSEK